MARRRRALSVREALEWAFAAECAGLDFGVAPLPRGVDSVAMVARIGELGCRVDGGGRSASAGDAVVIASFVGALPAALGGRGMAARVAALARAGLQPDPMVGARPRCVPVAWRIAGRRAERLAVTELVAQIETVHRGRRVVRDVLCCPVRYTPDADQIAAARAEYTAWRAALDWIGQALRRSGRLDTVEITNRLPPPLR